MVQTQADAPSKQDPKLALATKLFAFKHKQLGPAERDALRAEILELTLSEDAVDMYEGVCKDLGATPDTARLTALREARAKELAALDERIRDAEENMGDLELRDAHIAKADFVSKAGNLANTLRAFELAEEKTAGPGQKLDLAFKKLRLFIAAGDWYAVKATLKAAQDLGKAGGDWERKNRLKVYEAVFCLATRSFGRAAELFLDSIASFTATELFSYEESILYTVLTAIITLKRTDLKAKVVDSPEVLAALDQLPHVGTLLTSLYGCEYAAFMQAFAALLGTLQTNFYLHEHFRFYVREVRAHIYTQFLESYKSVTLDSMAAAFGVSVDFLDRELVEFIVAGRLAAKIDKVTGVIETNRPSTKSAQYQAVLKQGDALLNRLQKLSKVIDVE